MSSPHENELYAKATQLIPRLAQKGIIAKVEKDSLREYHIKLKAEFNGKSVGNIILYYAPTKKEFTLKCHELTVASLSAWVEESLNSAPVIAKQPSKASTSVAKPPAVASRAKGYQAYVDGSFIKGRVGFGAVVLKDGDKIQEFHGRVTEDTSTRQVAGELVATMTVLDWCQAQGITTLEIFYDYTGIEKWAKGKWKANLDLTQRYQRFMQATPIKVRFMKVESHTGNQWNDVADALAKKGALS